MKKETFDRHTILASMADFIHHRGTETRREENSEILRIFPAEAAEKIRWTFLLENDKESIA